MTVKQINAILKDVREYLQSVATKTEMVDMDFNPKEMYTFVGTQNTLVLKLETNASKHKNIFSLYGRFNKPYEWMGNKYSGKYNLHQHIGMFDMAEVKDHVKDALERINS